MKQIFMLSKANLDLSKSEVLSLLNQKKSEQYDDILIADNKTDIKVENRLGQSHSIYKFLFKCDKKELLAKISKYNWKKIYEKDFCARIHGTQEFSERDIAGIIYRKIGKPKVNLTNPKTKIVFFLRKNTALCGLFLHDVDKSFVERRAHLRPSLHPTSLHPGIARAMINLTGLKKGFILDPFCGSGGILIEAGLIGYRIAGYDIDIGQIERAKKNLKFYKVRCSLEKKDALLFEINPDAIVTDLPYGKSSKGNNHNSLYINFLNKAYGKTGVMVIMMPSFSEPVKIISKTRWKMKNRFEVYVHKSLTRVIFVLTGNLSH